MREQFADALQMHMRSCTAWMSSTLRVFCRTLVTDSHAGLQLWGDDVRSGSAWVGQLAGTQRLAIRVDVLLDLLEESVPPDGLRRFLERLAMPGEAVLYLPRQYLTDSERNILKPDEREGVLSRPGSQAHELLVVGFVVLRCLLGDLFRCWVSSLDSSAIGGAGAGRARQNLRILASVILSAMSQLYNNVNKIDEIPGLAGVVAEQLDGRGEARQVSLGPAVLASLCSRLVALVRRFCAGVDSPWIEEGCDRTAPPTPADLDGAMHESRCSTANSHASQGSGPHSRDDAGAPEMLTMASHDSRRQT